MELLFLKLTALLLKENGGHGYLRVDCDGKLHALINMDLLRAQKAVLTLALNAQSGTVGYLGRI